MNRKNIFFYNNSLERTFSTILTRRQLLTKYIKANYDIIQHNLRHTLFSKILKQLYKTYLINDNTWRCLIKFNTLMSFFFKKKKYKRTFHELLLPSLSFWFVGPFLHLWIKIPQGVNNRTNTKGMIIACLVLTSPRKIQTFTFH